MIFSGSIKSPQSQATSTFRTGCFVLIMMMFTPTLNRPGAMTICA